MTVRAESRSHAALFADSTVGRLLGHTLRVSAQREIG